MENKILISVAEYGELRASVLHGNVLYDLDIKHPGIEQKKGNIYKGKISRIEPSLEAAFIDYGAERHGFLPLKEISREYFSGNFNGDFSSVNIKDVIKEGQEIIVQIEKEERGNKGAALTTFVSLAGSYVVLMPNNPRAGGISRRIEGQDRDELRDVMQSLIIPADMGVIARTAGIGKSTEELQWDINILLQLWETINKVIDNRQAPFLIYQESDIATRVIKDHLRENIDCIIVDDEEVFHKVKSYLELVRPEYANKLTLYQDKIPLFCKYQIEKQIESAYKRVVHLPSGGSIVIDHTEALVSIDVNSAKATGGSDIEETALTTNLEASNEIARQLRLRDIGGLIVIDFIDMTVPRNQKEVVQRLREALKYDRARIQVGNITRFGLLEMSRQRLRPRIDEAMQVTCPRCDGQGTIRSIESLAYSILHLIEEEAVKDKVGEVQVQIPTELATYLLNEKRNSLNSLELRHNVRVLILPNQHLETPKYKIRSVKKHDLGIIAKDEVKNIVSSYKLLETIDTIAPQKTIIHEDDNAKPAINAETLKPKTLPPAPKNSTKIGLFKNIIKNIFSHINHEKEETKSAKKPFEANNRNKNKNHLGRNNNRNKKNKSKSSARLQNAQPNLGNPISNPNTQKMPQAQKQAPAQKNTSTHQNTVSNNNQINVNANSNLVAEKQPKQNPNQNPNNKNNSVNKNSEISNKKNEPIEKNPKEKKDNNNQTNQPKTNPNNKSTTAKKPQNTQNSQNMQNKPEKIEEQILPNNQKTPIENVKIENKQIENKLDNKLDNMPEIKPQNNRPSQSKINKPEAKIEQKQEIKTEIKNEEKNEVKIEKNFQQNSQPKEVNNISEHINSEKTATTHINSQPNNQPSTNVHQTKVNHTNNNTSSQKENKTIVQDFKETKTENQEQPKTNNDTLADQHRRAIEIFYNKSNAVASHMKAFSATNKNTKPTPKPTTSQHKTQENINQDNSQTKPTQIDNNQSKISNEEDTTTK